MSKTITICMGAYDALVKQRDDAEARVAALETENAELKMVNENLRERLPPDDVIEIIRGLDALLPGHGSFSPEGQALDVAMAMLEQQSREIAELKAEEPGFVNIRIPIGRIEDFEFIQVDIDEGGVVRGHHIVSPDSKEGGADHQ